MVGPVDSQKLTPGRKAFLEYLRTGFAHGQDFTGPTANFTHAQVVQGLEVFSKQDPASWTLLHGWLTTRLDLRAMTERHRWPEHTLRRRLHASVDAVFASILLQPYMPVDTNRSLMASCETFQEALLLELNRIHPGIEARVHKALRMETTARRTSKRRAQ